jgi:hypothetical protein
MNEQAEQVIRDVHKELPDVWLGGRQRYVLVEAITKAIKAERERCAKIAEQYYRPLPDICDGIAKAIRQEPT